MKKLKKIFCFAIFFIFLNGCQSVKDGLSGTKRTNSDEFLVQKKNPLILPPDYQNLPKPINEKVAEVNKVDDYDIQKILGQKSQIQKKKSNQNTSLESSILEKIKD
jgi:PBP1b-binding outer membrane lipoprotein LpoB